MKITLIRASVLALALLGFGASAVVTSASAKTSGHTSFNGGSGGTAALCLPSDPTACGMH